MSNQKNIDIDLLIIGGGTAGCAAAVEAKERAPHLKVLIMEKAHIDRSGCLAAGLNALNLYINPGETPEGYVRWARWQAMGLLREDLLLSITQEVNEAVKRAEEWGLPIQKDSQGNYLKRGRWGVRIFGEAFKPALSSAVRKAGVEVLNRVVATNFLHSADGQRVLGATGFGVRDGTFYTIRAKATIIATGGCAGLYRPNTGGDAHHRMWYSPFNTGTGYAMGIRAGAEMTSFEMRFVAIRIKDIIAPIGTVALGFSAPVRNAKGEQFMKTRYAHLGGEGAPTPIRVYAPTMESKEGRGPCYIDTTGIGEEGSRALKEAYLDMAPTTVLMWAANKTEPHLEPLEISGTEPYVVGGHCSSGYWITRDRKTTLDGLYAAGDVAGGAPTKFASGCIAEGIIAARAAVEDIKGQGEASFSARAEAEEKRAFAPLRRFEQEGPMAGIWPEQMEERLQKAMDEYAGGINTYYELNEERLKVAQGHIKTLKEQTQYLLARDLHQLMLCHDIMDRIEVAETLIEHLLYRKETRWPGYQSRVDFPHLDDFNWLKFVNSRKDPSTGTIEILTRPYEQVIAGDRYRP